MDGGLKFNNPALLALQEVQRLVPRFRNPDQLVTVGTGTRVGVQNSGTHSGFARAISHSSVGPAVNHYLASFDGTIASNDLYSMLSVADRDPDRWFRRFDVHMENLPDLADIHAMDNLAQVALAHFLSDSAVQDLALAILASNFYLELRRLPVYEDGSYLCYARIMSRVSVANCAFASLMQRLDSLGARFVVGGRLHREVRPTILTTDHTGNFCKPILFHVQELNDPVDVRLQFSDTQIHGVSANCITVRSLIELQRLEWVSFCDTMSTFPSGRKRRRLPQTRACEPVTKRRRDSGFG